MPATRGRPLDQNARERVTATIDVCVCTFRRASLRTTLASLAAQTIRDDMRVIVADNDATPSAQALVAEAREALALDILYLHAPERNISVARNACLDAAHAPLVAFIDDDEEAAPDWLECLRAAIERHDVVFGPVQALYPAEAPTWLVQGDFLSVRAVVRANGAIDTGYAGNVLIRASAIGAQRFDRSFGCTGGEDAHFFSALHRNGARLSYCPDAIVTEAVPPERMRLRWRVRRAYAAGQIRSRIRSEEGQGRIRLTGVAAAKAMYAALAALASLPSAVGWRASLIRSAYHLGVAARALGAKELLRD